MGFLSDALAGHVSVGLLLTIALAEYVNSWDFSAMHGDGYVSVGLFTISLAEYNQ